MPFLPHNLQQIFDQTHFEFIQTPPRSLAATTENFPIDSKAQEIKNNYHKRY